jgi:hypothetical protein
MKKILYFVAALAAASFITTTGTSCKFAPDQHDGDTVAASEFYPIDTSAAHAKKMAKIAAIKNGKDSVGIYYVGSNSTKDLIELVSYPSRRDTMMYSKTRHIKVKGNADINHVVRVDFYLHNGKDSLKNTELLQRFKEVEALPEREQMILMEIIGAYIRDFKTKQSYS